MIRVTVFGETYYFTSSDATAGPPRHNDGVGPPRRQSGASARDLGQNPRVETEVSSERLDRLKSNQTSKQHTQNRPPLGGGRCLAGPNYRFHCG